ncbi:MAG: hypothetical protein KF772_00530 [Cryobacterium sp.]|nr:hypothetical protein [Cryobacterium sp.]
MVDCQQGDLPVPLWRQEFKSFLEELVETAQGDQEVVGLVAFGSTADQSRLDEWSDHDFAWITKPGAEAEFRQRLDWLPNADQIALSAVEHHGGVKVIYADGHLVEFGIASLIDFSGWAGHQMRVLVDKGGVAEVVDAIARKEPPSGLPNAKKTADLFLCQILLGVGRFRRGEVLSAASAIRETAVAHLLSALNAGEKNGELDRPETLDRLDPRRRFDFAHPAIAAEIEAACRLDPESAALRLLEIAIERIPQVSSPALSAVRRKLGWEARRPEV